MLSIFQGRKPQVPPLFALGTLKLSEKVHWLASKSLIDPLPYVQRHVRGDWGCVDPEDAEANTVAVSEGDRILSAYPIDPALPCAGYGKNCLWIITEVDRAVTTILLPQEY